jgi:hypothetical protein
MAALEWDSLDERLGYEAGVSHGVFYPSVGPGVVWNGILSIDEDVEGGDTTKHYLDGVAFLTRVEAREFKAKLTALSAPKEFEPYSGKKGPIAGFSLTQQPKKRFNFAYQTGVGDDGCRIHLIYNVLATPDTTSRQTKGQIGHTGGVGLGAYGNSGSRSWVEADGASHDRFYQSLPAVFDDVKDMLYGTVSTAPFFPAVDELLTLFGVTP